MKTPLVTLILLLLSTSSFAQLDSSEVSIIAKWSIGDSYDFSVKKVSSDWTSSGNTVKDSTGFIANFKVLDSTSNSYKLQWSFGNSFVNTLYQNMEEYYKDKKSLKKIISENGLTKVEYRTNELGQFIEILNWEKISESLKTLMNKLEIQLKKEQPDKLNNIASVFELLNEVYTSKEGIEQVALSEIKNIHFPFGLKYDTNESKTFEKEIPNILGGDPISAEAVLTFEEIDIENKFCVVKEKVTMSPEETKRSLEALFKRVGIYQDKTEEALASAVFDVIDLNYFRYHYYPGIPNSIYVSRKVLIDIENSKTEKTTEVFIDLIHEED